MTWKDYEYWQPPYAVTITGAAGHPLGWVDATGTFHPCPASKVGEARGESHVVVWDGGMPDPMKGGNSKGRLLPLHGPRYVDSLTMYSYLATMTVEDYEDELAALDRKAQTTQRTRRRQPQP
jgi:hypothetical protein